MTEAAPLLVEIAEAPETGEAIWVKAGDRRIRVAIWPGGARGVAIVFPGRSEYIEKYGRVVARLAAMGFSAVVVDWRGQGLADRLLPDAMKGHVGSFSDYQVDVEAMLAAPEVASLPGPRVLICHSMGGCIGMRSLIDGRIAPVATVMSAPMLGIELKGITRTALGAMIRLSRRFGFETAFAPAPKAKMSYVLSEAFETNMLTGDAGYYDWFKSHLAAEPGFGLGAPTLAWMALALEESAAVSAAPPPKGPMLMFLGDDEKIVEPAAIRAFAARNDACRLVEIPAARHEVLMETEATQTLVWDEMERFFAANGV